MKIMYVVDQFSSHGGIEKILAAKINSFIQDYGFTVYLITSGQRNNTFIYPLDPKVIHYDLGINYADEESFFSKTNLRKKISHFELLKKTIREIKPDIIISPAFSHDQYFLPLLAKHIPKIKEVHFSGVILPPDSFKPSALSTVKFFFKRFHRVVLLNEDERKYFPNLKTVVIPNFVECESGPPISTHRKKTVIAAGRIAPVKQFDHLLKSWALLEKDFPEWQLEIYGNGEPEYDHSLKQLVGQLRLERAEFKGAVQNLFEIMSNSSLFAMSSANECFPMVLLEAKCAGLPSVSYDSPNGPRNIIRHNTDGIIVAQHTPEQLSAALRAVMKDNRLRDRMQAAAKQNSAEFSKSAVMEKWISLVSNL